MPRPSSPPSAKASVRSPYALDRSRSNPCAGKTPHTRLRQTMSSFQADPESAGDAGSTLPSRCETHPQARCRTRMRCVFSCPGEVIASAAAAWRSQAGWRWWSRTVSNRRPHACKARALPTELRPLKTGAPAVVGPGGLEPPTSRLSGVCSNQLSYRPETITPHPSGKRRPMRRAGRRYGGGGATVPRGTARPAEVSSNAAEDP